MEKVTVVTLVGPDGSRDVALPDAAIVRDLIPQLAEISSRRPAGDVDTGDLTLARVGGPPFPVLASVAELGMKEGEALELRGVRADQRDGPTAGGETGERPDWRPAPPQEAQGVVPGVEPSAHLLPRRRGVGERIGAAVSAATTVPAQRPDPVPAAPHAPPRPDDLSKRTQPGLTTRVRDVWRNTDYRRLLDEAIAAPRLRRCATIAVLSPKGGVGKTTVAALLGQLLAMLRADRVVAVDTNPDFGSLGRSLAHRHTVFVDDILAYLEHPALTTTTLDACLARAAHGLMVLPAPTDPLRMAALDHAAYARVIERLKTLVGVVILDCGTGLWDPTTRAAITSADQLVVVTDDTPTTASLVLEACGLLIGAGPPVTVVVNRVRRSSRLRIESVREHLAGAATVVVLPEDERAGGRVAAGDFDWDDAPPAWRVRVRELAALLVGGWSDLGITA